MCQHQPPACPRTHLTARRPTSRRLIPGQGWSLLCNGVVMFEDTGALLPDGRCIPPIGRPGSVNTAMQAWILAQPPAKIGAALHERFARSYEEGSLITPGQSARSLMQHLATDATGETWNVNTSRPEE
jgi:hypothetical protein